MGALHPLLAPVKRWTPGRKAAVCSALVDEELSITAIVAAHGISAEELLGWVMAHDRDGREGLRATRRSEDAA